MSRHRRPAWLFVPLAGLIAVLLVVASDDFHIVSFGTSHSAMQVTWLTAGLIVVCLVALPTLIVTGLAGFQIRVNLADWITQGWPS